ncbi:MAG: ABC transporter ATP-binding protein [Marinifilaceae bacterium]|jgi:putative ABC transport system ATP-binding protein|nr:ABC transporter ATP-binding protein [Marinifilaceae bacterium]
MIEIKNISKVFRTNEVETSALSNINIKIEKGEFLAIMGPSGCGKSTLLNIIGLLDIPSSGEMNFWGEDISILKERNLSKIRKANIGFVFQSFNLIDELSVYENIELALLYAKVPKSERKQRIEDIMNKMNIAHRSNHFPQQLSGGQQQRVAVARAVVANPKIILADEPTGNLDSQNGSEVMNILKELNEEGATIIMVTHSETEASQASRILRLFDGHIVSSN